MLNAITELIGDPEDGDVIGLYSTPMGGKTLMSLCMSADLISKGIPVYYLDTEGGAEQMRREWAKTISELDKLEIVTKRSINLVMHHFNVPVTVEISKGGKASIIPAPIDKRKRNEGYDDMRKVLENGGVVILDSMTSPIRERIPMVQQSFPARASLMSIWFGGIFELLDDVEKGWIWINHHATYNPADMYQTQRGSIQGGSTVEYFTKKIIGMEIPRKSILKNNSIRKLWAVRSPYHPAETVFSWVGIRKPVGFFDIAQEHIDYMLTEDKLPDGWNGVGVDESGSDSGQ